MKWLFAGLGVAGIALVGAAFAQTRSAFPSETVRYRLTLEAESDGKPVSGSGVIQVKQYDTTRSFGPIGGAGAEVTGEAVALDLGSKGLVFALLHGPVLGLLEDGRPGPLLLKTFADVFGREVDPLKKIRILQRERPRREMPLKPIPMLVRFRNISEPASVEQIHPDNFAAALGPGTSLLRVTIEITDDPVTSAIDARLPWLADLKKGGSLDGSRSAVSANNTLQSSLGYLSFKREGM